jgi:hypothetical protein
MPANDLEQVATHLQFLGYEIVRREPVMLAKHPKKMNVGIRAFKGGILFQAFNSCKDLANSDKLGYLNLMNNWNRNAAAARFYADKDNDLCIEAWYPGAYDRERFGLFLEAWEGDSFTLLMGNAQEATKYLK